MYLNNILYNAQGPGTNLISLPPDCLDTILLLLNRKDMFCTMFSCKYLLRHVSSQRFHETYRQSRHSSPASVLCVFDCESLQTIAESMDDPISVPISLQFLADTYRWRIIDSRDGLLLLEDKFCSDNLLICNPLMKTSTGIPFPQNLPPMYSLLAAGVVPEGRASWRLIALFGNTVKSVSRTREMCWIGSFNSLNQIWDGSHQRVEFQLPTCQKGVKFPSILTGRYWNVLIFNINILSVHLDTMQMTTRNLPFNRSLRSIHPHILGKNKDDELCLVMHDGEQLLVMKYAGNNGNKASEFKRYNSVGYHISSSFAEKKLSADPQGSDLY